MKFSDPARQRWRLPIVALAAAMSTFLIAPATANASAGSAPAQAPAPQAPAPQAAAPQTAVPGASSAKPAARPAAGAPKPTAASGRTATAAPPKCGGHLALGEVAVCPSIVGTDRDVFRVTSKVDGDNLFTMFPPSAGDIVNAVVTDATGDTACFLYSYASTCQLGAAGVYTITVSLEFGSGTGNYSLSVESQRTPSSCKGLSNSFFSFASPGLTGTLPAGSAARCFSFDQPSGSLLYTEAAGTGVGDVQGPILDAQYQPVCQVRYATTCTLSQPGPYHLFLYDYYGGQAPYTLRMPRVSASAGCDVVRPKGFGDQQGAPVSGTVTTQHVSCEEVRASAAGMVAIRFVQDQDISWTLYDNAGRQVCDKYSNLNSCPLPAAGDYTLLVQSTSFNSTVTYRVGVTSLDRTAGCPAATQTSWDLPALLVHQTSGVQVNCQPFHGQAGDRIVTYAAPAQYNAMFASLIDSTGAVVCPDYSDQDGCVLPATGTYRVVSHLWTWDDQVADATYHLQIRRLSSPRGCPTVTPGAYNAAPASALGGIRCRILNIPAAGSYVVNAVNAQNYVMYGQVYDAAGTKVCGGTQCDFGAPGRYTLVLDGSVPDSVIDNDSLYALALLPATPSGCPQVSDDLTRMTPYRGQFTAAGEYDCLRLASPAGARIMELQPEDATGAADPVVTVVDATGSYICDSSYSLRQQSCELTGTAPFYAVYKPYQGYVTGAYAMTFPRVDGSPGCPVLPRTPDGATVTTTADQVTACFSVPADQHAAQETFTYQRTSGDGNAGLAVFDGSGILYCGTLIFPKEGRTMTCTLPDGPATVILEGYATDATYQVTHGAPTAQ